MRSGPIALRAAGAALVLVLAPTAGTALAHDGVEAAVTPAAAAPGADVDVRVTGCGGPTGAAKSPAFVADAELSARGGGTSALAGGARVRSGLEEGTYEISVTCDGHDHDAVGTLRVGRHQKPAGQPSGKPAGQPTGQPTGQAAQRPGHQPAHRPTGHSSPIAPVHAGGGGTAAFAAPAAPGVAQTASEEGLGAPYTLLGFGMAALAAVAVAFRSARRRGDSRPGPGAD
ncbi:PT domain-containing protein [Streptomyces sp. NPDC004327]|uniref:PT domain-containing protein n=1 Tax=Streptomyces sp. NPDC004327 TaxID=3364699 RepID=UPI0036A1DC13